MNFLTLLSCFFLSHALVPDSCPLEEGKIISDISDYVLGEGDGKKVLLESAPNAIVFAIQRGEVLRYGKKTHSLFIKNDSLLFIYTGVNTRLQEGDTIVKGESIGFLTHHNLVIAVKREEQLLNAHYFINCS